MEADYLTLNRDVVEQFPWAEPLAFYCHAVLRNLGWNVDPSRSGQGTGLNSVLFTSPMPAQGVTTIASTTALIAASDPFCKTLYLDFSAVPQARSRLKSTSHQDPPPILLGRHLEQTALASLDYLWIARANAIRSNTRRKLALKQVWDAYDLILIDWPSSMPRAWLEHVAPLASVALVIAGGEASKAQVNRLASSLMRQGIANVGVIINQDARHPNQSNQGGSR